MARMFYLGLVVRRLPWVLLLLLLDSSAAFTSGWGGATRDALSLRSCRDRSDTEFIGYCRIGTGRVSSTRRYLTTVTPPSSPDKDVDETTARSAAAVDDVAGSLSKLVLSEMTASTAAAGKEYAASFDFAATEATMYALFLAMRRSKVPMGFKGHPFVLRREEIVRAMGFESDEEVCFDGCFTLKDFEKAVEDDFLDASRGSTDNRKGWKITNVAPPRGNSFSEARLRYTDVTAALAQGTVILNAAGAHIPPLAPSCLACSDAFALPNAVNLYITAAGQRTSAPPHTDRQDVVVIQTGGRKRWKVYAPPDPARRPASDVFARGKGEDNLPLYSLEEETRLLWEGVLEGGDVLFVPAAFPHTTSTVVGTGDGDVEDEGTSIHLTFNIESHVWQLDYLSARRLALRRAGVRDVLAGAADGAASGTETRYVGRVNELPSHVRDELFGNFPLGFLDDFALDEEQRNEEIKKVAATLEKVSQSVDEETASAVTPPSVWEDTVRRLRETGTELLDIHRDMYISAIDERKKREEEERSNNGQPPIMTPERMQRLSIFRVQPLYKKVDEALAALDEWSRSASTGEVSANAAAPSLPDDWPWTHPLKVGDNVKADLGGAFFEATVTKVANNLYDVKFFDGDQETGLERGMIKLLTPPQIASAGEDEPPPGLTKKEIKRWRKKQEKKKKRN